MPELRPSHHAQTVRNAERCIQSQGVVQAERLAARLVGVSLGCVWSAERRIQGSKGPALPLHLLEAGLDDDGDL